MKDMNDSDMLTAEMQRLQHTVLMLSEGMHQIMIKAEPDTLAHVIAKKSLSTLLEVSLEAIRDINNHIGDE